MKSREIHPLGICIILSQLKFSSNSTSCPFSSQACKNFYDDGVCKQECPPMQIYNPIKYKWERDPLGKYAYGATCVKDCPEHLLKDNGACVRACPPKKKVRVMIKSR